MRDPRCVQLAKTIVRHSCALQPGETILIESFDLANGLLEDIVEEAYEAGGIPQLYLRRTSLLRRTLLRGDEAQLRQLAEIELSQMKRAQAYVGLRASENLSELSDVPPENMARYTRLVGKPVHADWRVKKTKWVVLRYPNASMAQAANMSTEAFEEYFYKVCNVDYDKMNEAIRPLVARMKKTDRVRVKGPGKTDLRFSIKDIGVVPCAGARNIPDGECFSAPVR
ncbi:MAG TPA: aminopeptidase, partial [Rhodothermales bacterium]